MDYAFQSKSLIFIAMDFLSGILSISISITIYCILICISIY